MTYVPEIQNPYDCIERVVHKLPPDEVRAVLDAINYYTASKELEALKEFFAGTWIELAAVKRGLDEEGRVALAVHEGLRAVLGWLDKEPLLAEEGRKQGVALGVALVLAREAMKHFEVPLPLFLAHFIATADEATVATALESGRALRDNDRAERRAALRLVT